MKGKLRKGDKCLQNLLKPDALGRAEKVTYLDGKEVSYPDGTEVTYGYDILNRLESLTQEGKTVHYGYDSNSQLIKKAFSNGMETAYSYDLTHQDKDGVLDGYRYAYDILGNKVGIQKNRRGLEAESRQYTYGYDAFGNRINQRNGGTDTSYSYNGLNQLISKRDLEGEEHYTYDRRGNLSQILSGESVKNQYLYGALNRMEQATNQTGEIARYTYNGLGYRVGKELGSQAGMPGTTMQPFSKEAVEKGLNPLEQLQSSQFHPTNHIVYTIDLTRQYHNLLQKTENQDSIQTYLWDGNVVGMLDNGKREPAASSYYLQDDLGSPIRLLYENGEVQESYGYGEFGEDLYTNQRQSQPFGYTGYQRDEVAGTYFAQAREYQSESGRFTSQDLIPGFAEYPFSMNRYSYCYNVR